MIARTCRTSPALWLFLFLCGFLYYQFSKDDGSLDSITTTSPGAQSGQSVQPVKSADKKPRIALVTFITDQKSYVHLSLKNKDHYARRHGYDFIVDYESHTNKGTCYWKFNIMERLIKKGQWDWIWWVDFDTLITNTDMKVTDVIDEALANATNPDAIDWIIAHDCNGLNMGSFILRGHQRSQSFIDQLWEYSTHKKEDGHDPSEQDAMVELLKEPQAAARTHRVPQWRLNSFPQEIACFDESRQVWEPGQLILHFAGAWAHVKGDDPTGQLMKKYEHDIIWGDWKQFY